MLATPIFAQASHSTGRESVDVVTVSPKEISNFCCGRFHGHRACHVGKMPGRRRDTQVDVVHPLPTLEYYSLCIYDHQEG